MNKTNNILGGLILIIIGLIVGANATGLVDINIFFNGWWTLFIIVPSFINLFKQGNKMGNIIGLFIGIFLLLGAKNIIDYKTIWKLIVPFILVTIGISIIFRDTINSEIKDEIKKKNKGNLKEYGAVFGSQDINYDNEEFKGCNLNAVFGGIKCDLQKAIISEDTIIEVSAIFGGVTILVPDNINVKISSIPIFGGVSDNRTNRNKDKGKTLYINATSMFGGVDIK